MLPSAQYPIAVCDFPSQVGRNQARLGSQTQQSDVAKVSNQLGVRTGIEQHKILRDELDIHHATWVVLEIEVRAVIRMTSPNFLAHLLHGSPQTLRLSLAQKNFLANALELFAQVRVAGTEPRTGNRLVFPYPGMFTLIALETFHGHGDKPSVAVRSQTQVNLVEPSGRSHGR